MSRILIVEDDPDMSGLLRRVFDARVIETVRNAGYRLGTDPG